MPLNKCLFLLYTFFLRFSLADCILYVVQYISRSTKSPERFLSLADRYMHSGDRWKRIDEGTLRKEHYTESHSSRISCLMDWKLAVRFEIPS